MLERVVEGWLTSTTEIAFQVPFAQLLTTEGYSVLQGPAHHPFEHGKDIIARDPEGRLCVFQLKTGDINVTSLEAIQGQIHAAVTAAVSYPGMDQGKLADRVLLVCSGTASPPARDRLHAMNEGYVSKAYARVELVEMEQLVGRFCRAQATAIGIRDLQSLLGLLTSDGSGEFQSGVLLRILQGQLDTAVVDGGEARIVRALSDALLTTAYSMSPWLLCGNHLACAQAWLVAAISVLRCGVRANLQTQRWKASFELAVAAARANLDALVGEASEVHDLVLPDLSEPLVYPTRALAICGWASAYYLSERVCADPGPSRNLAVSVVQRELPFVKVAGEAGAAYLFAIARLLELHDHTKSAIELTAGWLRTVCQANAPKPAPSVSALPNLYYSLEEALQIQCGTWPEQRTPERFDGRAYTAMQAVDWLAARGAREPVAAVFRELSRLLHVDVEPSAPYRWLEMRDDEAVATEMLLPCPSSWAEFRRRAATPSTHPLGDYLEQPGLITPYLGLLLPHRFNRRLASLLGQMH